MSEPANNATETDGRGCDRGQSDAAANLPEESKEVTDEIPNSKPVPLPYLTVTWALPTLAYSGTHLLAKNVWSERTISAGDNLSFDKEFTLFPWLIPELRLKIWELALPGPRTIGVVAVDGMAMWKETSVGLSERAALLGVVPRCRALTQVPAMLHATAESRAVALKHYKLSFELHFGGNPIYFNPKADTLLFTKLDAVESWVKCEPIVNKDQIFKFGLENKMVRYLQVREGTVNFLKNREFLQRFLGLETLTMDGVWPDYVAYHGWLTGAEEAWVLRRYIHDIVEVLRAVRDPTASLPKLEFCGGREHALVDFEAIKEYTPTREFPKDTPLEIVGTSQKHIGEKE